MISVVVIGVAMVVVTVLARRAVGRGPWASLRVLVPSWRFFDRAEGSPRLHVRILTDQGRPGPWAPVADDRRTALTWAFAPAANLALADQAMVEQLVAAIDELADAAPSVDDTGELAAEHDPAVTSLVAFGVVAARARAEVSVGQIFEWKIVVPGDDDAPVDYLRAAPEVA